MAVDSNYDSVIEEARRLWLEESPNAQIVRYVLGQVPGWIPASRVYRKTFGVSFYACQAFHAVEHDEWTDEEVNRFLDDMIAETCLGGELTAERLARHLGIPTESVQEIFARPENHRRMAGRTAFDKRGQVEHTELLAKSELLGELEAIYRPDLPKRYPYWKDRSQSEMVDDASGQSGELRETMTVEEWRTGNSIRTMLKFLSGKVSERKLRLFAIACCRRIWQLLTDERCRQAVEIAERYVEEQATIEELRMSAEGARAAWDAFYLSGSIDTKGKRAAESTILFAWDKADLATDATSSLSREAAGDQACSAFFSVDTTANPEREGQAVLLRCIFGNPFCPLPVVSPDWLAWSDATVPKIAKAIYEGCCFDRLPILADALEDAGCKDPNILAHCREPGEHVRGCWVVDLLLGKS